MVDWKHTYTTLRVQSLSIINQGEVFRFVFRVCAHLLRILLLDQRFIQRHDCVKMNGTHAMK